MKKEVYNACKVTFFTGSAAGGRKVGWNAALAVAGLWNKCIGSKPEVSLGIGHGHEDFAELYLTHGL